jgi:RNase P subunit RPR2
MSDEDKVILLPAFDENESRTILINKSIKFLMVAGLKIIDEETRFTAEELIEDDIWFDKTTFSKDDMVDMINIIADYNLHIFDGIKSSQLILKLQCPSCKTTLMTKQQLIMNTISTVKQGQIVVCNNCGEINIITDYIQ